MKRIFIALAILLSLQIAANAQKSPADAKKAVEAAVEATANPKKAAKVATWIKLADSYMAAYSAPAGAGLVGAGQQELQLIMGNDKPKSTEEVVLSGEPYMKEVYERRNYYYSNGVLSIIEITKPVYKDALAKALEAYVEGYKIDVKGSKTKDIKAGILNVASKYLEEGMNCYMFGDLEGASRKFAAAADAAATEPACSVDSTAIYNAGFTACMAGDNAFARKYFEKCLDIKYYEDGEVYAKLAEVDLKLADTLAAKAILEDGFAMFPQNQSILIGLINYYIKSGDSPEQLFVLLDKAKENEPGNASLYYVEGDIHNKLGHKEEAIAAYLKSNEINPEYEFGLIGIGILHYNEAIEIQEKAATEMDDAKYMALVDEFEAALMNAIDPFEKAFAISKDEGIKVNLAEYLKNIYYRFRDKDQKFMDGYLKYDEVVKNGK
ncbi:MAG: hypothetical protein NC115_04170 [Bacteroidales bacterium]|nr:hypothetical protein [Bacteroidales bacterium]